jgi:regulator of replication initiation timing
MAKELSMEIMAPGTWNGFKFPKDRLKKIADNFKKLLEVHRVPLKIGHTENQMESETSAGEQHALGWADEVWITSAGKLMARFIDVPKVVYDAISKKLYRKVSVELDFDTEYKGENIGDVLSGVALLGADIPAVNTIEDLQAFFSKDSDITGNGKAIFTTIETEYLKEEVSDMDIKDLERKFDDLVKRFDTQQEEITNLKKENDKFEKENQELKTAKENFEKQEKERKEEEKKNTIKLARDNVNSILDDGVKAKTITPAERESFKKILGVDDDESVTKIEVEVLKTMVGKGSVNFSSRNTSKSGGTKEETNTGETPDAKLARKANELVNAGTAKNFKAAKTMIMRTDTELAKAYIEYNDTLED